jgi:hypothetical protein
MTADLLWLLEWVVVTACAAHDVQHAFRWSMNSDVDSKELLKYCFIGIESIRNSFDIIFAYLTEWITCSVSRGPPFNDDDKQKLACRTMLIRDDDIAILADELELRFPTGTLRVKANIAMADQIGNIRSVMLAVWKHKHYSYSRWLNVEPSASTMVGTYLTGLSSLLSSARQKSSVSGLYLHDF